MQGLENRPELGLSCVRVTGDMSSLVAASGSEDLGHIIRASCRSHVTTAKTEMGYLAEV